MAWHAKDRHPFSQNCYLLTQTLLPSPLPKHFHPSCHPPPPSHRPSILMSGTCGGRCESVGKVMVVKCSGKDHNKIWDHKNKWKMNGCWYDYDSSLEMIIITTLIPYTSHILIGTIYGAHCGKSWWGNIWMDGNSSTCSHYYRSICNSHTLEPLNTVQLYMSWYCLIPTCHAAVSLSYVLSDITL